MKNLYAALLKKSANSFCFLIALLVALMGVVTPSHLFAQAPTISYGYAGPRTYYVGLPVQLSPTSTGVSAPGYSGANVLSDLLNALYIAYDQHGNIYVTASYSYETQSGFQNGQTLYEIPLNGTGNSVQIGSLTAASGVAADKWGNVWVADKSTKAVYKVAYGSSTPVLVASGFNNPEGLAVDASDNVYVADEGNAALEKIPAAGGAWTTVASGLSGANSIGLDGAGNIFIAATGGIFRVPAGGSSASLYLSSSSPTGVAIDPSGTLYVADATNQRITKYPATGGSVAFPVDQATSVALDQSGNVYCGRLGAFYVEQYKITGGYYLTVPLPAGLSFSNSTGIISGTPTTVTGGQGYTVIAYNAAGSAGANIIFGVANPPQPAISYASPQTYPPGAAITPLAPASSYVAPLAYSGSPVTVGSGLVNPVGVAVDPTGDLYIADDQAWINSQPGIVYEVPANGSGQIAPVTGLGDPTSLATDAAGNLYISDTGNLEIFEMPANPNASWPSSPELQEIGPIAADGAGNVYTIGQYTSTLNRLTPGLNGESPFGPGFSTPAGVAADFAGNVYVSDAGNNNIVKISPDGSSSSVLASIQNPGPITVDAGGNLYIVNTQGNLYTITAGTTTALQIGSGLTNVSSLAIDGKGNIYYTDISNHVVKKISPVGGYFLNTPLPVGLSFSNSTGIISGTTTAGSPATNYSITAYNVTGGTSTILNIEIIALAISYSGPDTYSTGAAITPLTPTSSGVSAPGYSSSPVALGSGFKYPAGVAFDAAGNVYVADENNNAVYKIPVGGGAPVTLGSGFNSPLGVAVDAAGNVFVADASNNAVKEIPVGGGAIITLGSGFKVPASLALDAAGNIYVADFGNGAIKKIPVGGGATITLATVSTNTQGVAVDAAGNVYFGTVFGNQVKMIPVGGGGLVTLGSGFNQPRGVAVDATGNVYVGDFGNNAVKEIPVGGGAPITLGSGFSGPEGVAIDPAGNIYVADGANAAVKKIKPVGGYYINPLLPAGLSLDKGTGIISGTPTVASPATNYTVFAYNSSSSTTAAVNIKTVLSQTITFNALPAKTYGDADFAPGATSTNSVAAITYASDNTAVATIVNGNIHVAGAGTANITASQAAADSTHSAAADVKQQLTVNQAPLTITANNQTMTQGQSVPSLTASYSGFVNEENSGSLTTLPSITTTGTSSSPVGMYPITVNGAADANYSISYVAGTLNITPPSSVATLGGLVISAGTLSPAFASATTVYTAAVANSVTSIAVTPIPNNLNAAITVNGAAVPGATRSGDINLAIGANTITIIVTAEDGVTTVTYTITVTRAGLSNANLSNIQLSSGSLSPVFASGTAVYTASVINTVSSIQITPTTGDPDATVTINGTAVPEGTPSGSLPLTIGPNYFTIKVIASNGTTVKTYSLTITRPKSADATLAGLTVSTGALSPAFAAGATAYTAPAGYTTTTATVTPVTNNSGAAVTVNGKAVASGSASASIVLATGYNTINVVVTSQDKSTTNTYTITVARASPNANLSNIAISSGTLTPAFATATTSYTASVANVITSIKVTPTTSDAAATATVNGTAVKSGTASAAIPLIVGSNTIVIKGKAFDGTAKTYVLTVTRPKSSNANLVNLAISSGTLTPVFATATSSYTALEVNSVNSLQVTPTTSDPTATVTINGTAVTSGTPSAATALVVGPNYFTIKVTAQDGTVKTYAITVTRAKSSDASLANLAISSGILTPAFAAATSSYTASLSYATTTIKVTPTINAAGATVKINGTAVASGSASASIALATGYNTITTVVTAQDGSTTNTYTLVITRTSPNANLSNLTISGGTLSPAFATNTSSYTDAVSNATTSVTVTPTTADAAASVTVDGTTVTSGAASAALPLVVGSNAIVIKGIAFDGTVKTYVVTVIRSATPGMNSFYEPVSTVKPAESASFENDGIVVHAALSPNGDGVNDFLTIDGITNYPDNHLMIIDRSGALIYQTKGYDNSTRLFDGHSNLNGKMQLPGTYFYSLDYTIKGETKHKTGFIVLKY